MVHAISLESWADEGIVIPIDSTRIRDPEVRRAENALMHILGWVAHSSHRTRSGVDKAGYITLAVLEREGIFRLSDLAARLSLDVSTVSRQIKNLEDRGFAQRTEDPKDRRASVLALTSAGQQELETQRATRWAPVADVLAAMSPDRREEALRLLDELAAACTKDNAGRQTR